MDSIADPELVPDIVYALAGTTFVQTVTASALSLTVPLLKRGFNDPKTAIKRKCAVITENMGTFPKMQTVESWLLCSCVLSLQLFLFVCSELCCL